MARSSGLKKENVESKCTKYTNRDLGIENQIEMLIWRIVTKPIVFLCATVRKTYHHQ